MEGFIYFFFLIRLVAYLKRKDKQLLAVEYLSFEHESM